MPITANADLGHLDPICFGTNLIQVLNNTVAIRGMWTCLASEQNIRHFSDIRKCVHSVVCTAVGLQYTRSQCKCICPKFYGDEIGVIAYWRVIVEIGACEAK